MGFMNSGHGGISGLIIIGTVSVAIAVIHTIIAFVEAVGLLLLSNKINSSGHFKKITFYQRMSLILLFIPGVSAFYLTYIYHYFSNFFKNKYFHLISITYIILNFIIVIIFTLFVVYVAQSIELAYLNKYFRFFALIIFVPYLLKFLILPFILHASFKNINLYNE